MPKKRKPQRPTGAKVEMNDEEKAERARRIQEWAVRRWHRDQDKRKQEDKCAEWRSLAIMFHDLSELRRKLRDRRDSYKKEVHVQFRIDKPPTPTIQAWKDVAKIHHDYENLKQEFEEEKDWYHETFYSRFRIDKQPEMPSVPAGGLYVDDNESPPKTEEDAEAVRLIFRELGTPESELPSVRQLMRLEVAVDLILMERARKKSKTRGKS
jgi:hypothetical protein